MRATGVLARGQSWCVPKSVLLAALCRAAGIACRLGYANVRNHMATRKLLEFLGTDVFYYHGYNEIFCAARWVKATVAFNRTLCEKARLAPLDFDGEHDSIYHPVRSGRPSIHGIPARLRRVCRRAVRRFDRDVRRAVSERYPARRRDAPWPATFEAEIAAEAAGA